MAGVLDPGIVDQLRALAQAGNPDLLDRLQVLGTQDTPGMLRALRSAVAAGDAEAIAFNVHALKGSAANLGAIEVVSVLEQIENVPAGPGAPPLEPLLAALEQHAGDAQAALTLMAEAG
jgi:HPt (histidine-containing phosphotransfer) domain-containing protein